MNFDEPIDRKDPSEAAQGTLHTWSEKWACAMQAGREDVLPMWVADMDFAAPPAVQEALRARMAHPVLGYTLYPARYFSILQNWYQMRHDLTLAAGDFLGGAGTVTCMAIAVRALTAENDGVLIFSPVYPPFRRVVIDQRRHVIEVQLATDTQGVLRFDPQRIRAALDQSVAAAHRPRLILFCSPHNPGGRVWSAEELSILLEIAANYDMKVVSNELHSDLRTSDAKFLSMAAFDHSRERVIVIGGPSKTFNLASFHTSHFITRDTGLRRLLAHTLRSFGHGSPGALDLTAAMAAYEHGALWLDALCAYLRENLELAVRFFNRQSGFFTVPPQATYLLWIDATAFLARLNDLKSRNEKVVPVSLMRHAVINDTHLVDCWENEARVKLSTGSHFGSGGENHLRLNVACPRAQLQEALARIEKWLTPFTEVRPSTPHLP